MKILIDNWLAVAVKSHSMWAFYLGLIAFNMPDILFLSLGYDVASPRFWSMVGNVLFVYGIIGRLKYQGIER